MPDLSNFSPLDVLVTAAILLVVALFLSPRVKGGWRKVLEEFLPNARWDIDLALLHLSLTTVLVAFAVLWARGALGEAVVPSETSRIELLPRVLLGAGAIMLAVVLAVVIASLAVALVRVAYDRYAEPQSPPERVVEKPIIFHNYAPEPSQKLGVLEKAVAAMDRLWDPGNVPLVFSTDFPDGRRAATVETLLFIAYQRNWLNSVDADIRYQRPYFQDADLANAFTAGLSACIARAAKNTHDLLQDENVTGTATTIAASYSPLPRAVRLIFADPVAALDSYKSLSGLFQKMRPVPPETEPMLNLLVMPEDRVRFEYSRWLGDDLFETPTTAPLVAIARWVKATGAERGATAPRPAVEYFHHPTESRDLLMVGNLFGVEGGGALREQQEANFLLEDGLSVLWMALHFKRVLLFKEVFDYLRDSKSPEKIKTIRARLNEGRYATS